MLVFRPFPESFYLRNLAHITARAFELKCNPHVDNTSDEILQWFVQSNVMEKKNAEDYARQVRFDKFAALTFPDADEEHFKTCLAFFYWGFVVDDLSDEGELKAKPELVKASINRCREALYNLDHTTSYPHASMLQDLFKRIKATATPGACARFIRAYKTCSESQIKQTRQRSFGTIPSVEEFIVRRRDTSGAPLVEAMIEYALDIDLPDHVFDNKIIKALSDATTDIMIWPNDLCSLNKEQAENDFQNLVICIMTERNIELQDAINVLTDMLDSRVTEYLDLKSRLPSFGKEIDAQLSKYLSALEHFVQGTVVWYQSSPRYFSNKERRTLRKEDTIMIKLRSTAGPPDVAV